MSEIVTCKCGRPAKFSGLCGACKMRAWREANPEKYKAQVAAYTSRYKGECVCGRPVYDRKRGLCAPCYTRTWREQNPSKYAEQKEKYRRVCDGCGALSMLTRKLCPKCYRNKYVDLGKANEKRKLWRSTRVTREGANGFTRAVVAALRELQGSACGICRVTLDAFVPRASVHKEIADHCHATGEARGLLCQPCNVSLGYYEKHQRLQGLRFREYEEYLDKPPAKLLECS